MPDDPIVNDHTGIFCEIDREIQARYFWGNVLEMKEVEKNMIEE